MKWPEALPLALLRVRIQPGSNNKISPYELVYGRPYQMLIVPGEDHVKGEMDLKSYLVSLGKTLAAIQKHHTSGTSHLRHSSSPTPAWRLGICKIMELRASPRKIERTPPDAPDNIYCC